MESGLTVAEYNSLIENKIRNLVELPLAEGYAQKYGIDYDGIFSPVVCFSLVRFLLAFAVQHEFYVHQMDVETAFLNGKLDEEIACNNQKVT